MARKPRGLTLSARSQVSIHTRAHPILLPERAVGSGEWRGVDASPVATGRRALFPGPFLDASISLTAGVLAALLEGVSGYAAAVALFGWCCGSSASYPNAWQVGEPRVRLLLRGAVRACGVVAVTALVLGLSGQTTLRCLAVLIAAAAPVLAVQLLLRRPRRRPRVLLVGERSHIETFAAALAGTSGEPDVAAACVVRNGRSVPVQKPLGVPTTTRLEDVGALAERVSADSVLVLPGPELVERDFRRLAWSLEEKRISLAVAWPYHSVAAHRISVDRLAGRIVLDLSPSRRSRSVRVAKSALDRALAGVLLILSAPLIGAMWLAVKLESPGPGFFRQKRVGHRGQTFTMLKMRTMCDRAHDLRTPLETRNEGGGPLFKIREDPRVTRVGRWLRRSSLDELPQLVNVVRGEMSLVGPRPALPDEVAMYDEDTLRRLVVKPGITGLWQVSGRSDLSWDEAVRLDLHYADNWRLLDDLAIAARTVSAVVRARGAY